MTNDKKRAQDTRKRLAISETDVERVGKTDAATPLRSIRTGIRAGSVESGFCRD